MASLFDRLAKLARTPKGRRIVTQATAKAQELSKDPANRAKVERLRAEVTRRMNSGRKPPTTGPKPPTTGPKPPTG